MTITTSSDITAPVNYIFQQTLLRNAKARCPYFVGSSPAEIQQNNGTFSAKWRRIENMTPTTTALSALSGAESYPFRSGTVPTMTDYTTSVAKYGAVVALNEEVDLVNYTGMIDKIVEILGIQAGRSLNRLQRNELEDNATQVYASGTGDSTVSEAISLNAIRRIVNTLKNNVATEFEPMTRGDTNIGTAPIREAFWGICHVDVEEDVRQLQGFRAVETYASQTATESGEFGMVHGVRFVSTSEGSIDTDSGGDAGSLRSTSGIKADLYSTPIFGMDAVGSLGLNLKHIKEIYKAGDKLPAVMLIQKEAGSGGSLDPLNELRTLAWKSWHGVKILNPLWIYSLRSGASKLTN